MKECKLGSGLQLKAVLKQESIKQTDIKKGWVYCKKKNEWILLHQFFLLLACYVKYCSMLLSSSMLCQILLNVAVIIIIIFMRQTYFLHTNFTYRGGKSLQKSRRRLKILGTINVTWSNFHNKGPHILDSIIQNLVSTVTWHLWFVHPYLSTLNVIHNLKVSMLPCW